MITRFDHAVIAVADLHRAIEAYRALGFDVFPGGRHEHRGTHNALIRFGGADYIELLGVYDSERAIESGLNGRTLAEFVRDREGGLVGHCYATDDIRTEAARTREAGLEMVGPFEMKRERPDGRAAHLAPAGAPGHPVEAPVAVLYRVERPGRGATCRGGSRGSRQRRADLSPVSPSP